jgi:glycosyltransferase involved in cell wall biosynthesis
MDGLYACSNFISRIARREWGVAAEKIFVTHHGVEESYFHRECGEKDNRDPYRIAYATHPSKGLDAAVGVLRRLRRMDERFELHVFGGNKLWGQTEQEEYRESGLVYCGLIGQRDLAKRLTQCGFALYMQTRPEPFGIAIVEAQAAGCITLASAVGAHPEIIDSGATGFLLEGDPADESVRERAATIIASVAGNPSIAAAMRRRAQAAPLSWDTVAASWGQFWQRGKTTPVLLDSPCSQCGGEPMLLADGYHCASCSYYSRGGDSHQRANNVSSRIS